MLASATDHNRGSSRAAARKTNWRHRLSHRRKKSPGTNSSGRNSCSSTSVDSEASKMDKILFRVAAPLLALVRVAHVIPKTSTTYTSAIKRKLITVPYIADAPANLQQSLGKKFKLFYELKAISIYVEDLEWHLIGYRGDSIEGTDCLFKVQ